MKEKYKLGKRSSKKGASPLIATVILIGFAIVLAMLVYNFNLSTTANIQRSMEREIRSAELIDFQIKEAKTDMITLSLLIENDYKKQISNFTTIITGNKGTETLEIPGINQFTTEWITTRYNANKLGNITKIELIPKTEIEGISYFHDISTETTTKIKEEINETCLIDSDSDGIPDCIDNDFDGDNCPDNIDFNLTSACLQNSCSVLDEKLGCSNICEPITCKENEHCNLGVCKSKEETKCEITSVLWSSNEVMENNFVELVILGKNCPDGKTVNISYEEEDSLTANEPIDAEEYDLPTSEKFKDNKIIIKWKAKWFIDLDGNDPSPDIVALVDDPVKSNILEVKQGIETPQAPLAGEACYGKPDNNYCSVFDQTACTQNCGCAWFQQDEICVARVDCRNCLEQLTCEDVTGCSWTTDNAPIVNLNIPLDQQDVDNPVRFNCSATDDFGLRNITLYGNWSTGWHKDETKVVTGLKAEAIFNKVLPSGNYEWNCLASDTSANTAFAQNNYTFNVNKHCNSITYSNWIIDNEDVICGNKTIIVNGNLTILNNGNLTLNNITLIVNTTGTNDGERRIEINPTGSLIINNSNFSALNANKVYSFLAKQGSRLNLMNSYLDKFSYNDQSSGNFGRGLYINTTNIIITNNTFTTTRDYTYGIYLDGISNIKLDKNTINTQGLESYGIYFKSSNNNNISSSKITTNGDNAYSIYFDSSADNIIKDSILNSINSKEVYIKSDRINTLLNTTSTEADFDVSSTGKLIIKWYLDVYVRDISYNAIEEANVIIRDNGNYEVYNEYTMKSLPYDPTRVFMVDFNGNGVTSEGESPVFENNTIYTEGKFNQSILFKNNLVYLIYNSTDNFNIANGTMEFWFKPNWYGNDSKIYTLLEVKNGPGTYDIFKLLKYASTKSYLVFKYGYIDYETNTYAKEPLIGQTTPPGIVTPWKPGEWHHIVLTWNNNDTYYEDGRKVYTKMVVDGERGGEVYDFECYNPGCGGCCLWGRPKNQGENMSIGRDYFPTQYSSSNGSFDLLKIYFNKIKSDPEIREVYNYEKIKDYDHPGYIIRQELTEYNETISGRLYYTNYTVYGTNGTLNDLESVNLTNSKLVILTLEQGDITPPNITIYSPPIIGEIQDTTPLINVSFGELVKSAWYNINNNQNITLCKDCYSANIFVDLEKEDSYILKVYANDSAKNIGYNYSQFTINMHKYFNDTYNDNSSIKYYDGTIWNLGNVSFTKQKGINLALYKPYALNPEPSIPDDILHKKLTDNIIPISTWPGAEEWTGWTDSQPQINITSTLDESYITNVSMFALSRNKAPSYVYYPNTMEVSTSLDGINYQLQKTCDFASEIEDVGGDGKSKFLSCILDQPTLAKYVKLNVTNKDSIYNRKTSLGEIQINGSIEYGRITSTKINTTKPITTISPSWIESNTNQDNNITLDASVDGGVTWNKLTNNELLNGLNGNSLVYRATLSTQDNRIISLLETSLNWSVSNTAPTHSNPILKTLSDRNLTTEDLICINQSTFDADYDSVINIYNWYKNDKPLMLLYMPFEGGYNSTYTKDYSGYGNDGSVNNAIWIKDQGKISSAYKFDGVGDEIIIKDRSELRPESFTVEAWINSTGSNNLQTIVQGAGGNAWPGGWRLFLNSERRLRLQINFSGGVYNSYSSFSNLINLNQFNFVALTYNQNRKEICFYINNNKECYSNPNYYNISYAAATYNLIIGNSQAYTFNGTIDEFRFYNYSLTWEQISQHYNLIYSNLSAYETRSGENYICEITPNDGYSDGISKNSSELLVTGTPPNVKSISINGTAIGSLLDCGLGCYIEPRRHSNVSNLDIIVSTNDPDADCSDNVNNASIYLCLIPYTGTENECNESVANYSFKLDKLIINGNECNFTFTTPKGPAGTPQFYIAPGTYALHTDVKELGIKLNTDPERDSKWTYMSLIETAYLNSTGDENYIIKLGDDNIELGQWNPGIYEYNLTNWGNVPLNISWNATDPANPLNPTQFWNLIEYPNRFILDDDINFNYPDSGIPAINISYIQQSFTFANGLRPCVSYLCNNNINETLSTHWHINPPYGLQPATYRSIITYKTVPL